MFNWALTVNAQKRPTKKYGRIINIYTALAGEFTVITNLSFSHIFNVFLYRSRNQKPNIKQNTDKNNYTCKIKDETKNKH